MRYNIVTVTHLEHNMTTDANGFRVKHLRCEWQVVVTEKDYLDRAINIARKLAAFPTHAAALEALPQYGQKHKYVDKWVPHGAANEYQQLEVMYREVPVDE